MGRNGLRPYTSQRKNLARAVFGRAGFLFHRALRYAQLNATRAVWGGRLGRL
jgi:hypothetical protein